MTDEHLENMENDDKICGADELDNDQLVSMTHAADLWASVAPFVVNGEASVGDPPQMVNGAHSMDSLIERCWLYVGTETTHVKTMAQSDVQEIEHMVKQIWLGSNLCKPHLLPAVGTRICSVTASKPWVDVSNTCCPVRLLYLCLLFFQDLATLENISVSSSSQHSWYNYFPYYNI